jgi:hypothetical protein
MEHPYYMNGSMSIKKYVLCVSIGRIGNAECEIGEYHFRISGTFDG